MKKDIYEANVQLINPNCEAGFVSMPIHFKLRCFVEYNSEGFINFIFIKINEGNSLDRNYKYYKKTNYALKEISDMLFDWWSGTNGSFAINYLNIKKISK